MSKRWITGRQVMESLSIHAFELAEKIRGGLPAYEDGTGMRVYDESQVPKVPLYQTREAAKRALDSYIKSHRWLVPNPTMDRVWQEGESVVVDALMQEMMPSPPDGSKYDSFYAPKNQTEAQLLQGFLEALIFKPEDLAMHLGDILPPPKAQHSSPAQAQSQEDPEGQKEPLTSLPPPVEIPRRLVHGKTPQNARNALRGAGFPDAAVACWMRDHLGKKMTPIGKILFDGKEFDDKTLRRKVKKLLQEVSAVILVD